MSDPADKGRRTAGGSWFSEVLTAIVQAGKGLPPALRFGILALVAIVVIVLRGADVPTALMGLLYFVLGGVLIAYVFLEFVKLPRATPAADQPRQTTPRPSTPVPPPASPRPDSTPDSLRSAYCHWLVRVCNRLPLETIDPKAATRDQSAELELSEVYTALDVAGVASDDVRWDESSSPTNTAAESPPAARDPRPDRQRPERVPATAALSRCRRLVLLGDPGSGKSTLANFVSLCLAGDCLGSEALNVRRLGEHWKLPRLVPVRVVLREYAAEGLRQGHSLWDFIAGRLAATQVGDGDLAPFVPLLADQFRQADGGLLILDGLDEVPEASRAREMLKDRILAFCDGFPRCRVLITARPYAYQNEAWRLPGFEVRHLVDFNGQQIGQFIDGWYRHIAAKDGAFSAGDAERYAAQLKGALQANPRLKGLAPRPLLLTLMASLHRWRGGGALPKQRQDLYEQSVNLLLDLWQRPKQRPDAQGPEFDVFRELGIPQDQLRRALDRVAYEVHRDQAALTGVADIAVEHLAGTIFAAAPKREHVSIQRVTQYVTDRAGLLIERAAGSQYAFPHRTFQEYLAACHLTNDHFPYQLLEHLRQDDERWREVVLLAASKATAGTSSAIWMLVSTFCGRPWDESLQPAPADWYAALRAAQALIETEQHVQVHPASRPHFERLRTWLTQLCARGQLPCADRAAAGRALAVLGDPRPGVGLRRHHVAASLRDAIGLGDQRPGVNVRNDGSGLPDVLWCDIPAGTLKMGASKREKGVNDNEIGPGGKPLPVDMRAFRLAAYPVTNAQFRPFVEGDGYRNKAYWTQAEWADKGNRGKPFLWEDPDRNIDNHPVVGVTWYEAVAYCRWLTARLREQGELEEHQQVRLPTEAEREWAARGPAALRYPWGKEWEEDACNSSESGLHRTTAVGLFPRGACNWFAAGSAAACHDLSGNVSEWCATKWRDSYEQPADEDLEGNAKRVLRGGAHYQDRSGVRGVRRGGFNPGLFYIAWGFRLAQ